MKVLVVNGSPRALGNVSNILHEVCDILGREGVETEEVHVYDYRLTECNACYTCEIRGDGRCADEEDGFNGIVDAMRAADGILIASPTYMNGCPSMLQNLLERAIMVTKNGGLPLRGKVGGAIVTCSHDGGALVYNQIVDFLLRGGMLAVGSYPLPIVRALHSPDYEDDAQGMRGVRALAEGMADALSRLGRFRRRRTRSPPSRRCGPRPPSCRGGRSSA